MSDEIVLTKKPICPHCSYIFTADEVFEITKVQGAIMCHNCGTAFFFDTEVIIYYKTFKHLIEYLEKRTPVFELETERDLD